MCIKSLLNPHTQLSSGATVLIFGLGIHLLPYFEYAISKSADKTAQMHSLVRAYAAWLSDKYYDLISHVQVQLIMEIFNCLQTDCIEKPMFNQ